ncbi:hypothetical protein LJC08_01590 [Methanimicrococcus sp. OttesenSCG-928-J09]|nr:hypothetical protein [Methanimicrococcus sp. OttesenSCG-928-J09]
MHLPNAKLIATWSQIIVATWSQVTVAIWSQVAVLQWEGDVYEKSLRDFCGCCRQYKSKPQTINFVSPPARVKAQDFRKIEKITTLF